MSNERAEELIRKYLEGKATPEEEALLESWYLETAKDQPDPASIPDYAKMEAEIWQPLLAEQSRQPIPQPAIKLWPRIAAAAAVVIVLTLGSLYLFRKKPVEPIAGLPSLGNDIQPAGTRATLTLIDGTTIALDSAGNKTLTRQENATVHSQDGQLIYTASGNPTTAKASNNTLTTRPGEHYSLLLPDGTKVWLNASSSITYPVAFTGTDRTVTVTGEGYFEIIHNAKQPFRVNVKDQLVEDLGTHLNINAYDDETTITTTLLEGSIKVVKGGSSTMLKPGQQATIQPGENTFQVRAVDADAAIAWKNGYFFFDSADIKTVMRQLARWYDIQVVYKGQLPKRTFKGKVYRNIRASEALSILAYFGAHFSINGKTITVSS